MYLPNADQARVDRAKITEYLLSETHPDGRSKAAYFMRFGFSAGQWEVFSEALRNHAARHAVVKAVESSHGVRYTVEGAIETPDGRNPRIRTVWVVVRGNPGPRLITAYPFSEPK